MPKDLGSLRNAQIADELRGADFGDARLTKRAVHIAEAVVKAPEKSFPRLAATDAELEGTYRFLNNPRVTPEAIVAAHARQTAERCSGRNVVLVAHDTTEAVFSGERDELGYKSSMKQSFLAHCALALTADEEHVPLGTLALQTWTRSEPEPDRKPDDRKKKVKKLPRSQKESIRWDHGVDLARAELPAGTDAIHLMDQEADDYALLAHLKTTNARFVVRGDPGRVLSEHRKLHMEEVLAGLKHAFFRDVRLTQRLRSSSAKKNKEHPPRDERTARLHVRSGAVTLRRNGAQSSTPTIDVNVVQVFENSPPPGEEPVSWTLLTSEPINTTEQVEFVVDCYRARWRIEEFFKALKSGCALERRQLCSYDALTTALALLIPVAWRLMLIRHWGRAAGEIAATSVFTPLQLDLLRVLSQRVRLSSSPSLSEVMYAIAGLGGHLKRNGAPGWQTLSHGYQRFQDAEAVAFLLARHAM